MRYPKCIKYKTPNELAKIRAELKTYLHSVIDSLRDRFADNFECLPQFQKDLRLRTAHPDFSNISKTLKLPG